MAYNATIVKPIRRIVVRIIPPVEKSNGRAKQPTPKKDLTKELIDPRDVVPLGVY
jgi:hypothetical protein